MYGFDVWYVVCSDNGNSIAYFERHSSSCYPKAPDGGNIHYLKAIPVRLYCDPDINWIIENRSGNYRYRNAADLSECIYAT
ncbi:hypothetical protein [Xanthocytophaga agilis]|uniref:Uncharacterized protein n=1 Tax=Xanthocytophaga agilis TaxID=3048010 RepID=A0AAE3R907_9BACT|nr:hypothetical protein [Xanthocytophaga agilis]MDJ1503680.1 hypothetical protein [Xanthocytophaga agilis]MDJ1503683.1 hypothetical protein [Xanthocytophaga agilis]